MLLPAMLKKGTKFAKKTALVSVASLLFVSSLIGTTQSVSAATSVNTKTTVSAPSNADLLLGLPSVVTASVRTSTSSIFTNNLAVTVGNVSFLNNGSPIAGCINIALSALGTAGCTIYWTNTGLHTITANYSGGSTNVIFIGTVNYQPSTGTDTTNVNDSRITTTTTISTSDASVMAGDNIQYNAVVTQATGIILVPDGTITFKQDGMSIPGCANLAVTHNWVNLAATCSVTANAAPGEHTVTAEYTGSVLRKPSSASLQQTVRYPLTLAADNQSREYGETNPDLTFTLTGFQGTDNAGNSFTTQPTCTTTATTTSPVGEYAIDCTSSETDSNKYVVTSFTSGTLTITAAPIEITVGNLVGVYGDTHDVSTTSLNVSGGNLKNSETIADLGTPNCSTTATTSSPVGDYDITCSGFSNSNYDVTTVSGVLSISPATLTIAAHNFSRLFGLPNPSLSVSYYGFMNGDDSSDLSSLPVCTTTATSASNPGNYEINCAGATADNYTIGYIGGVLTINPLVTTARTQFPIQTAVFASATEELPAPTVLADNEQQGEASAATTTPTNLGDSKKSSSKLWLWILIMLGILGLLWWFLVARRRNEDE